MPAHALSDELWFHDGPWSEQEYLDLPPGGPRIELVDGSLLVSPAPSGTHQRICRRPANALERSASDDVEVIEGVNLRVVPGPAAHP